MITSMLPVIPQQDFYVIVLPWPLSFNAYKDRMQHTTKAGRIWRDLTIGTIRAQCGGMTPEPLIGRVAIYWELWAPEDNRRRDLDNFTGKHVLDAVVKAGVMSDDNVSVVVEEHKYYRGKNGKGGLIITVMEV
jgi:Holliday junction resolvase RusA-like endonuclease